MNRVRSLATVGLVTAFGLAGPALAQTPPPLRPEVVRYVTVQRTVQGGPPFPVRAVFRSNADYQRFFRTKANAPCDFTQEFLILVHLGTQGSDGYTVRVTGLERTTNPPTVTVKYRIAKGSTPTGVRVHRTTPEPLPEGAQPSDPNESGIAPAELIKVRKLTDPNNRKVGQHEGIYLDREQLRFFEEGGLERVGFNVISRALTGQPGFEQLTVDFAGDIKVRKGGGEPRETRVLLAELERLATCVQNSQIRSLPRTIPTTQYGGRRFFYNHFDSARRRTIVEGTLNYEGTYADRLRPLAQAFDLIMARLERRPVRIEGTVEAVDEADAIRIQGTLGLSFYLRGPLARKLVVLQGRKVILEAVAQLMSATTAEGVISSVLYPQRSQIAGKVTQGGGLSIVCAPPMPEIPIKVLGPRAEELASPEVGNTVMLDMWLFFNNEGIPTEGFAESILAATIAPVVLRDRPDAVSLPTGELPAHTTVWVSARRGGADGISLASGNNKSGWCPSQLLRFVYQPRLPGLSEGIMPREPTDARERERLEREAREALERARNPNR